MTPETLLLHVCCAHCAAYPVRHWRQAGYRVSAFWYNPNVQPYLEHESRLDAVGVQHQSQRGRKAELKADVPQRVRFEQRHQDGSRKERVDRGALPPQVTRPNI